MYLSPPEVALGSRGINGGKLRYSVGRIDGTERFLLSLLNNKFYPVHRTSQNTRHSGYNRSRLTCSLFYPCGFDVDLLFIGRVENRSRVGTGRV